MNTAHVYMLQHREEEEGGSPSTYSSRFQTMTFRRSCRIYAQIKEEKDQEVIRRSYKRGSQAFAASGKSPLVAVCCMNISNAYCEIARDTDDHNQRTYIMHVQILRVKCIKYESPSPWLGCGEATWMRIPMIRGLSRSLKGNQAAALVKSHLFIAQ